MADNFISFNRFTALPQNISEFGVTLEEIKTQRGTPDRNPAASPMPAPAVSLRRLSLKPGGSDQLRVGEPDEPEVDPYEGPQSTLSRNRSALRKLRGSVISDLQSYVQQSSGQDPETRSLMDDSIKRVLSMAASVEDITQLSELVYVRAVGAARG